MEIFESLKYRKTSSLACFTLLTGYLDLSLLDFEGDFMILRLNNAILSDKEANNSDIDISYRRKTKISGC